MTATSITRPDPAMVRRLGWAGYLAAVILLLDHGGDAIATVGPADWQSAVWRVQATDAFAARMVVVLVTDLALLVGAALLGHRRVARAWTVGQVVLGGSMLGLAAVTYRDAAGLYPSIAPAGSEEFRRHFFRTLAVLLSIGPLVLGAGWLARSGEAGSGGGKAGDPK